MEITQHMLSVERPAAIGGEVGTGWVVGVGGVKCDVFILC